MAAAVDCYLDQLEADDIVCQKGVWTVYCILSSCWRSESA